MRKWDKLNEMQLAVLERVGAGDDLSSPDGVPLRRSARALADRGLVMVSRRGGGWRATITDAGRYYLEQGRHADELASAGVTESKPEWIRKEPGKQSGGPEKVGGGWRRPPHATAAIAAERRAAADNLLAKLQRDGEVLIEDPSSEERDNLRRVIDFAKRHGLAPGGQRIVRTQSWNGSIRVRLVSGSHPNSKPVLNAPSIPVPEAVKRWHPLLAALTNPGDVLDVSESSLPRAMRIMHALLMEAEQRGYEVGWSDDTSQGVEIRIGGYGQIVTVEEEQVRQDVLPSAAELAEAKAYDWQRVSPESKMVPSGKLMMRVAGPWWFRTQQRWADRKRWSLEDRLSDVLATVEELAREKERRKCAEEGEELARQRAWEDAMMSARKAFWRDRQAKWLLKQVEGWEQAEGIRAYCQAAGETGRADAEWLTWARAYADEIDPLTEDVGAPEYIEPGPEDLRPYLGRWSPYGPERR